MDDKWGAFCAAVRHRLEIGEREFDNAGFSFSEDRILGEIQQELLDLVGWPMMLIGDAGRWREQLDEFLVEVQNGSMGARPLPRQIENDYEEMVGIAVRAFWMWRRVDELRVLLRDDKGGRERPGHPDRVEREVTV